jgi:hypothetical protein
VSPHSTTPWEGRNRSSVPSGCATKARPQRCAWQ